MQVKGFSHSFPLGAIRLLLYLIPMENTLALLQLSRTYWLPSVPNALDVAKRCGSPTAPSGPSRPYRGSAISRFVSAVVAINSVRSIIVPIDQKKRADGPYRTESSAWT